MSEIRIYLNLYTNLFLIIAYYIVSLLGLWDGVCQESQK